MWNSSALSGRSGEIRSTDGPSRLNISVTLFPNCVVVPEAGTAVRAKQSCAGLRAAVYGIHINRRSHMASQSYQLAMVLSLLFLNSVLGTLLPPVCKCLPSPFMLPLSFRQSLSCVFLSHSSLHGPAPPALFTGGFPVMHTLCFVHTPVTKTVHCVCSVHRSCAPCFDLVVSTHLSSGHQFRLEAE